MWAIKRGHYECELPADVYSVSVPYPIYGEHSEFPLKEGLRVTARVKPGQLSLVEDLVLEPATPPSLFETHGVLIDSPRWSDNEVREKIDHFAKAWKRHYRVPGVSLAVVKDGNLFFHRNYGVSNAYTKDPVTDKTLFEACSITKTVFAFAVCRLADRGEIDLDRPLREYLTLEEIASDPLSWQITARHVLTHRSGLPNWRYNNADGRLDIKFKPGAQYGYSGEGFVYLSKVIERIKGQPIETVLMDEVQVPMGLESQVYFSECDELQCYVAHGHHLQRPFRADIPPMDVAGNMHTTAKAFSNFMIKLMRGEGLSQSAYSQMLRPQSNVIDDDTLGGLYWPKSYGLGFRILDTPFGKAYGHSGDNGDFKCVFEVYADRKAGFVVFTNGESGDRFYEAIRKFLILGEPQ